MEANLSKIYRQQYLAISTLHNVNCCFVNSRWSCCPEDQFKSQVLRWTHTHIACISSLYQCCSFIWHVLYCLSFMFKAWLKYYSSKWPFQLLPPVWALLLQSSFTSNIDIYFILYYKVQQWTVHYLPPTFESELPGREKGYLDFNLPWYMARCLLINRCSKIFAEKNFVEYVPLLSRILCWLTFNSSLKSNRL